MKQNRSNPPIKDRVNSINSMLRSISGTRRIQIDPKCKELIKDFEQVAFKEGSYHIDKDRDRLRTHVSDALGYLLWDKFKPGAPVGERTNRLLS